MFDFSNKAVIVTGAGRGIGAGIAIRFAEAGAHIVVNYRTNEASANEVAEKIKTMGKKAILIRADVSRHNDVESLVKDAVKTFGRIDILINNAGTYPLSALLEMSEDEWNLVINTNLRSVHLCTQAVARQMINQKHEGAIINIASIEGENPAPQHSHYNAAKGGVLMYTRASAQELGKYNIRVNAVSPGLIWKEGLEKAWPDGVRRYLKTVPLKRLGYPDDVADTCLFLASPASRWITGVNLRVDGGMITSTGY
ncbi:MAG: 3-oxoacyl-ACP reductase FabG [Spirochaetota bacterium]|nr:MAG: 3-oxoacyl-ACP reductase FabG [Spirochaetota bacterium]